MIFKGGIFSGARKFHLDSYLNGTTIPFDIKNYKCKNKVGIQAIKVVKQEKNDGSYYSIAWWEIPTLA